MSIPATRVPVSGERFLATYALHALPEEARALAEAICVEQTIEFPEDLIADDDIRGEVIGRIESLEVVAPNQVQTVISYAVEITAFALPQLLSVAYGNCSLLPGVRLLDLQLPDTLLDAFGGPRFGIAGIRDLVGAPRRPLLATALKPLGLGAGALADMAGNLARGGIDLIKDDQGLADQPWAPFSERVPRCAAAVIEANERYGMRAVYLPVLNAPTFQLVPRAYAAKAAGAGGLLVMPGVSGLDAMRGLADDAQLALPLMAHPAFEGSFVASDTTGMAHSLIFGTLARLAGADLSIFPGYGGRFGNFSRDICREISDACRRPLGALAPCLPTPGGGMTVSRTRELLDFYGRDVALLVGGDLHRGDAYENARRMREAVETMSPGANPMPGGQAAAGE